MDSLSPQNDTNIQIGQKIQLEFKALSRYDKLESENLALNGCM